jgi:hypothetical protein
MKRKSNYKALVWGSSFEPLINIEKGGEIILRARTAYIINGRAISKPIDGERYHYWRVCLKFDPMAGPIWVMENDIDKMIKKGAIREI